jgi:hypothetical protein
MLGGRPFTLASAIGLLALSHAASCSGGAVSSPIDGGTTGTSGAAGAGGGDAGPALPTRLSATVTSTRFMTADHMLASMEMQISGEPFAQLLGRNLGGYDRFSTTTDNYTDPTTGVTGHDPLGFSLAVESYEYSKQPMNNLSFESGAGVSLQYGPILNPTSATGDPAYTLLLDRLQYLAAASRASGAKVGKDFVTSPAPTADPTNYYGWPGFWPTFAEFRSFDPAIHPSVGADHQCSLVGAIDEPLPPGTTQTYVGDYECDYNSLNLPDRDQQVDKVIEPDALGFTAWKQGLWVINYWSSMHDGDQDAISVVDPASLAQVGVPDNTVIGQYPSPLDPSGNTLVFGSSGTYLGDVSLEGWQGLVMLEELDNKTTLLLKGLTTVDGATLGGVASFQAALDYDYTGPIRWWPASVAVTETVTAPSPGQATKYFPQPSFAIQDATSRLQDLVGLLGGISELYAMTDANNVQVGGTQQFLATFDGAPFAADDGLPDGEDTMHDRTLGILKMALVNADRIHFDSEHAVLVDTATVGPSGVTRGTSVSTVHTAYSIVALRTALRALDSSLVLYSNDTPDSLGMPGALDSTKLDGAPYQGTLGDRIVALIKAQADFLSTKLLDASGAAANGYDLQAGAPDPAPGLLEAQASAIRGLLDAYLATSDQAYRQRAEQAYAVLDQQFWMDDVRVYRTTAGESSTMTYTPRVFAAVHGALRQYYKLVASSPGHEAEAEEVLARVLRGVKLILNGWDDLNQDTYVQPNECLGGRLQMAERALTGELSIASDKGDRDHDCVPDIATAGLPSALAAELTLVRK